MDEISEFENDADYHAGVNSVKCNDLDEQEKTQDAES